MGNADWVACLADVGADVNAHDENGDTPLHIAVEDGTTEIARIPFVSPNATNPDITSAGCDVCNRVALSDALQGAVDAGFVFSDLGFTSVAVVHDNSDYGKGLAEIFQNNIIDLGAELTGFEGVQVGDTDFRAMLARVGAAGP